jgi:hypothetical protein
VLIAQNSYHAAAAEELYRFLKTFAPVKKLNAKAGALLPHKAIEIRVTELLVNRAQPRVVEKLRQDLREEFPVTEMTEREHDRSACAQLFLHELCTFHGNERCHPRQRHRVQLYPAQKVAAEALKMPSNDPPFLGRGFFLAKRDLHILPGEPSIIGQQAPGKKTEHVSDRENEPQRQRSHQTDRGAIEKVNAKIDHAGRPATAEACGRTVILPASRCNHYNVRSCSGIVSQPAGRIMRGFSLGNFHPDDFSWSGTTPINR